MSENFNFGRLEGLGHDLSIRDGYGEIRRNGILVVRAHLVMLLLSQQLYVSMKCGKVFSL